MATYIYLKEIKNMMKSEYTKSEIIRMALYALKRNAVEWRRDADDEESYIHYDNIIDDIDEILSTLKG